ncbi:hypothetical protein [Spirosoma utsteinense]|uniref:Uncharacterized protein n=1 Tax=Spirosoma utsteinense TaxID=2585773 RepID=A0ABR6VZU3_9BACT|nr:hypothetical protein [Spirosoma utsteinense]MBC3789780.1 hypothetical protein [Spirosoma utsteinense]
MNNLRLSGLFFFMTVLVFVANGATAGGKAGCVRTRPFLRPLHT